MEVIRKNKYVNSSLEKFGMDSSNPVDAHGTRNQLDNDATENTLLEPSEDEEYRGFASFHTCVSTRIHPVYPTQDNRSHFDTIGYKVVQG